MSKRRFHRTLIRVEVLTEDPIEGDLSTKDLFHLSEYNGAVSDTRVESREEIDALEMSRNLQDNGVDPDYYGLTKDGEDV